MDYKGLTLDKFQEDAIAAIEAGHSVVVSAPTGSGKTLIADYIIEKDIRRGIRVVYTAPIKALSNQKYKEFCKEFGEENVGLMTGDIVKNPDGMVLIMTTEIYRNMAIIQDQLLESVTYVVFDEIHFINDIERGYVWEESIIFSSPKTRFLCLSATIPNADEFAAWISTINQHKVVVIRHETRNVPLYRKFYDADLGIATLDEIKAHNDLPEYHDVFRHRGRREKPKSPSHIELIKEIKNQLPCFFFCFSRKKCQDNAYALAKAQIFQPDPRISSMIRDKLQAAPREINNLKSTQILRETLPLGIGFHHAGLLPITKELVEDLFAAGLIKVLYTTETFAVGINMPAKSVCFESLRKFDGVNFRNLTSKEYFQIAGRAGRRGIDKEGFAYAMIDRRDFDYNVLRKITSKDTEPIKSQFRLSVNTVLNLILRHKPEEIALILTKSFHSYQRHKAHMAHFEKSTFTYRFDRVKSTLAKMGYLEGDFLTEKGEFASHIYSEEILTSEIFATPFYHNLTDYQILMLIAVICYEPREKTQFIKLYPSKEVHQLSKLTKAHPYIKRIKRFKDMDKLTALVHPCYYGKSIFEIINNTSLLEGDIIRFFRQILDRISQIKSATREPQLQEKMHILQQTVIKCISDVDAI